MATATTPSKVILFLGIMFRDENERRSAIEEFSKRYGNVSASTEPLNFSYFSEYYDSEMGGEVKKSYLLFEELIDREQLSGIKSFTNELEKKYGTDELRPINLDPGYLTRDKFVLASAKDFAHRIYIGDGIYAEVTLHFHQGKTKFFSWTYKDYLQETVENLLLEGRKLLV